MNTTQHEAERLAALGLSVIRIALGQKHPLERWTRFAKRARTPAEARRDFATPSNIAIATGPVSGLVGVDCDSPEAERFALRHFTRSPMLVRSPRGGLHIYYRLPPGEHIRCAVKPRGIAMDLRASHGYLLCPDSANADGVKYRWVHGPPTAEMLRALPVFHPAWLAPERQYVPCRPRLPHECAGATARARARSYISHIVAREHERGHDATYRATQLLREFGLTPAQALEELLLWNRTNALPPWSEKELRHKVNSVFYARGDSDDS